MRKVSTAPRYTHAGDVIDWDETNMPHELRMLPPGRYILAALDESAELTPEEETAVLVGLDDLQVGNVVPLDDFIQELESHSRRA